MTETLTTCWSPNPSHACSLGWTLYVFLLDNISQTALVSGWGKRWPAGQAERDTDHLLTYLFESQPLLMHVAQVEHGLGIVLLLWCQSVVCGGRLVVHLRTVAIVVVVTHLYPRYRGTWSNKAGLFVKVTATSVIKTSMWYTTRWAGLFVKVTAASVIKTNVWYTTKCS